MPHYTPYTRSPISFLFLCTVSGGKGAWDKGWVPGLEVYMISVEQLALRSMPPAEYAYAKRKKKKRLGNGHWHTQKVDCQMLFRFYWPWYEWLKRYVFGRSSCSCSRVYLVVFASVCSCSCGLHELQVQVVNQRSLMHMQYDAYSKSRRRWWGLHASLRLTVKGELGYSVMWQKVRSC